MIIRPEVCGKQLVVEVHFLEIGPAMAPAPMELCAIIPLYLTHTFREHMSTDCPSSSPASSGFLFGVHSRV